MKTQENSDKPYLNFDLMAMVQPKTQEDIVVLAKEAISELEGIIAALDGILARP